MLYNDILSAKQYEILRDLLQGKALDYSPGAWGALVRKRLVNAGGGAIALTTRGERELNKTTNAFKDVISYIRNTPECNLSKGGVVIPQQMYTVRVLRDLGYFEGELVLRPTEKLNNMLKNRHYQRRKFS